MVEAAKEMVRFLDPFVKYSELGARIHSEPRSGVPGVIDPRPEIQTDLELGRVEPVGASDELPGVEEYPYGPRLDESIPRTNFRGPEFRRDNAERGQGEAQRYRAPPGHAASPASRSDLGPLEPQNPARNLNFFGIHDHADIDDGAVNSDVTQTINGRFPRHLASALILTERDADEDDPNTPKVKGRIITTLFKAKEVRPVVESA